MNQRKALIRGVEAVTFLFAAFSGYLKGIAPPEAATTVSAVGAASLLTLCIVLLLSGRFTRKARTDRLLKRAGAALTLVAALAALIYLHNLDRLTFGYPPEEPKGKYIAGTEYSPDAARLLAEKGPMPDSVLVAKFGGPQFKELVWSRTSIERSRTILIFTYLIFVVSIASAIFTLVESQAPYSHGAAGGDGGSKRRNGPAAS